MIVGHVPVGGACFFSAQCADHGSCDPADGCGDQMCCPGSGSYCQMQANGTEKCVAQLTSAGSPCDDFSACARPLVCNLDFVTGMGTCYEPALRDQVCDPEVIFGGCASELDYCDPEVRVCKPKGTPGQVCSGDGTCVDYAYCDAGECKARPLSGEACGPSGAECLGDLICSDLGECAEPPAATACL